MLPYRWGKVGQSGKEWWLKFRKTQSAKQYKNGVKTGQTRFKFLLTPFVSG